MRGVCGGEVSPAPLPFARHLRCGLQHRRRWCRRRRRRRRSVERRSAGASPRSAWKKVHWSNWRCGLIGADLFRRRCTRARYICTICGTRFADGAVSPQSAGERARARRSSRTRTAFYTYSTRTRQAWGASPYRVAPRPGGDDVSRPRVPCYAHAAKLAACCSGRSARPHRAGWGLAR